MSVRIGSRISVIYDIRFQSNCCVNGNIQRKLESQWRGGHGMVGQSKSS